MTNDKKSKNKETLSIEDNFMQKIRDKIYIYVSENNMSIETFAEKTGISFNTLSSLLYKTSDCKLSTFILLSKILNMSVDELWTC